MQNLTVITGGARSGKSQFAESLALESKLPVTYVATMEEIATDFESLQRIDKHRRRRPTEWHTLVAPFEADQSIAKLPEGSSVCIFDCLSLYVSNILLREDEKGTASEVIEEMVADSSAALVSAMSLRAQVHFFLVTNEVGSGIVPENRLARLYRDLLGFSNQTLAGAAADVWLCCAGIPLAIKKTKL